MSGIGSIIVGGVGLILIGSGLYTAWVLIQGILSQMAAGNVAGVLGLGLISYFFGVAVIVILLGVGIGLVVIAIDD